MNRTKIFGSAVLKLTLACILGLVVQTAVFAITPKPKIRIEEQPGKVVYAWEEDDESDGKR